MRYSIRPTSEANQQHCILPICCKNAKEDVPLQMTAHGKGARFEGVTEAGSAPRVGDIKGSPQKVGGAISSVHALNTASKCSEGTYGGCDAAPGPLRFFSARLGRFVLEHKP